MPYQSVCPSWGNALYESRMGSQLVSVSCNGRAWGLNCPKSRVSFVYRATHQSRWSIMGELISIFPRRNGEWNFTGAAIDSRNILVGFHQEHIKLISLFILDCRETRPQRSHPGMCICFSLVIFGYSGLQTLRICTMLYSATTSKRYRF